MSGVSASPFFDISSQPAYLADNWRCLQRIDTVNPSLAYWLPDTTVTSSMRLYVAVAAATPVWLPNAVRTAIPYTAPIASDFAGYDRYILQ